MTADGAVSEAAGRLGAAGCGSPRRDAEYLLCLVLGTDRAGLYAMGRNRIHECDLRRYSDLITVRASRVPLQHIAGCTEFYGLSFRVSPDALVPRPETEILLERFIEALPPSPRLLLDVGTGSGILAVCLSLRFPEALVMATDLTSESLSLAAENARLHSAGVSFVRSDLIEAIGAGFDGMVANLPYIPEAEIPKTQPEVRFHDPRIALDGGRDGMLLIRRLVADAPRCLAGGGVLALEAAGRQPFQISKLMERSGAWRDIRRGADLAGKPRWVTAKRK
jgi:release factor glutamine methyltransferase